MDMRNGHLNGMLEVDNAGIRFGKEIAELASAATLINAAVLQPLAEEAAVP